MTIDVPNAGKPALKGWSISKRSLGLLGVLAAVLFVYGVFSSGAGHTAEPHEEVHHHAPSMISVIPFVGLLLCIAVLPLIPATMHWWESNSNRMSVSVGFASVTLLYYVFTDGMGRVPQLLEHAILAEYIPFIILLFSLYVISGGICLRGDLAARPSTNTAFLAIGALIASFVGTTGASMLLIRPLLQTNAERKHVKHTVIFFIFLVSNIGGTLLPIGDPPLFLGYLRGVPFLWTFGLWPEWLFCTVVLLTIYFIWDCRAYKHEEKRDITRDETQTQPLTLTGKRNLLLLAGVVFCVALVKPGEPFLGTTITPFPFLREVLLLGLSALSLWISPKGVRTANKFDYHAILEVAALFIGIFICMQAPIEILRASGEQLQPILSSPGRFFWATGALSSLLDNAPTYLVFFQTAESMTPAGATDVVNLLDGGAVLQPMLIAISLGAVFMGAMTYIGNGPNFMVKSIAEQSGVRMPSFFGYMAYSVSILIPLLILLNLIFM